MTYEEAKARAERGKAVVLSMAGGWKRYGWFTIDASQIVEVRLFHTTIARFHPDGRIEIRMGGYNTPTTKDALNALVSERGVIWTDRKLGLVYNPHQGEPIPFTDGMEV
jgi:hypothetical protein